MAADCEGAWWECPGVGPAGAGGVAPGEFATTPRADGYAYAAHIDPLSVPPSLEVAALTAGSKWTGVAPGTGRTIVTYSFAHPGSVFAYSTPAFAATLTSFSGADQDLTRAILGRIAAVCNVDFVEVPDTADGCGAVRYAYSQQPALMGLSGYAFYPAPQAAGGDVWLSAAQAAPQWDFYRPALLLHETLHALGLKHPFEPAPTLPAAENIIPNTVMSYSPLPGSSSGVLSRYPAEPMPIDVAALQYLYGAAPAQTGATVYDLSAPEFQAGFRTIWDAGGIDVLDAGGLVRGVTLDLNEGGRSNIGVAVAASGNVGGVPMSTSYTQTLSIAFGARIEHAVGTPAADVLIGNELANRLQGGGGDDRIDGGAGVDTAVFTGPRSAYLITHRPGAIQVADTLAARDGTDSLVGVERLAFSDSALAFDVGGSAGTAYRLYQAAFGRAAEPSGLGYWIGVLDRGAALHDVAGGFTGSHEFGLRYGSPDLPGFVTQLYANVLHRAPDEGGLAFHVGTLASGASDRPQVLVNFSESPENWAALVGTIEQGVVYV